MKSAETDLSITAEPHANRLAREKSPYLLQHQFNPVDWQAWGPEAFRQARNEQKPIFLSIGYSTCHWCHVMERESFENEAVARFLNQHFVSIKVDREERPDVDRIYMTFVQATTGQGGWPLNVFLTPDLKPFFGGTYFPVRGAQGRPGFMPLLEQIQLVWSSRRASVEESAADIHNQLTKAVAGPQPEPTRPDLDLLRDAAALLKQSYDPRHGGFGGAPKFPQPSQPRLLLRCAKRFRDDEALRMVLHTCDQMAAGGIHDQLGGGFSRYSVDAEWLVPHFEKMLYDNAQLADLYLDAFLISGQQPYAEVVRDILDYVLRDMTHPDGGFFSAEDADSEGHEGKFYCWTLAELRSLLTANECAAVARHYGITDHGNFVDHSHPQPLPNQNVLSVVEPLSTNSDRLLIASARRKMLEARTSRVRPHLDDKVLASWNGLMLGAMARAYSLLGDQKYRLAAEKNLAFLKANLWDSAQKALFHRWRDGERDQVELLEGYAFLLSGVLDLYEATLDPGDLEFAIDLADSMLNKFYDREQGGFWQNLNSTQDLILRFKEPYDGAEPSGNSVTVLALLRLGKITGRNHYSHAAEKSLELFGARMQKLPQALPYMLQAVDFRSEEPRRVVVTGDQADPKVCSLLRVVHSIYQPNKVVLGNRGSVEPFAHELPDGPGAMVYVCSGTACQAPTSDPEAIKAEISC
jgi:uncharacterized protein